MRDRVTAVVNRSHVISGHAGIQWEERFPDLRPGVLYFDCERLSACITRDTCRQNWEASRGKIDADAPNRSLQQRSYFLQPFGKTSDEHG
ncbi:hypothetical protein MZ16F84_40900 [Escherichia coli]